MSEMWEEDDELSGEEEIIDEKELIKEKTVQTVTPTQALSIPA